VVGDRLNPEEAYWGTAKGQELTMRQQTTVGALCALLGCTHGIRRFLAPNLDKHR
jgi:hypothetical protein